MDRMAAATPYLVSLFLVLGSVLFFLALFSLATNRIQRIISGYLAVSFMLVLPFTYSMYAYASGSVAPWWVFSLGIVGFEFSSLLSYIAISHLLYSEMPTAKTISRNRDTIITLTCSIAIVITDYIRKDHYIPIGNSRVAERSWIYFINTVLVFTPMIYLGLRVIIKHISKIKIYRNPTFVARVIIGVTGYVVGITLSIAVVMNVFFLVYFDRWSTEILPLLVDDIAKPICFLLLILAPLAPTKFLLWLSYPFTRYTTWKQRITTETVEYLHERIIKVVPRVHLPNPALRPLRVIIEIDDARDLIWSVEPCLQLTAQKEARHLWNLLQAGVVISTPGNALPPTFSSDRAKVQHYLGVAKELRRLEGIRRARHVAIPKQRNTAMSEGISSVSTAIPTLSGWPALGNLFEFKANPLALFLRTYQECGDLGRIRIGPWPIIMLNTPAYAQMILAQRDEAVERPPRLRNILQPLLGHGLLMSSHSYHRRHRKLVAPAFQHRRIASYADTITQTTLWTQQQWTDGMQININQELMRLTLSMMGQALFGIDLFHQAQGVKSALQTVLTQILHNSTSLVYIPYAWPTPANRRFQRALRIWDATIDQIITERRHTGEDRGDLLSMLLQAQDEETGTGLTDREVRDEAKTLLFAGHETTATALAWTLYLLAQHPQIYQRVRDEVDHVLQGRAPRMDDVVNLPYTLQVFKEALRLYPPVYIIPRYVMEPIQIGAYTLRPGDSAGISPYVLHRRPELFPDPERFDPDRWMPEHEANLPRHAYLPFGAGPHICIGNHLALLAGHLILATLVQQVIFARVDDAPIGVTPQVTLQPERDIIVRVQRREVKTS
jgi:cytochrome P450